MEPSDIKKESDPTAPTEQPNSNGNTAAASTSVPEGTVTTQAVTATATEEALPSTPTGRDVIIGDDDHTGTIFLNDLIYLHNILLDREEKKPSEENDVEDLAVRLTNLMLNGKKYVLSGLKDVPKPFLRGQGRFFEKKESEWKIVDFDQAKAYVAKSILSKFKTMSRLKTIQGTDVVSTEMKATLESLFEGDDPAKSDPPVAQNHSAPRPCDVLFLPIDYPSEENMPYDYQSGNKHLLFLASQHVTADTNESSMRVEVVFKLLSSKVDVSNGTELVQTTPRYVKQLLVDNQNSWKEMEATALAEFITIFVLEVYLEKQIHGSTSSVVQAGTAVAETVKPSTTGLDAPTVHDVLFGRGGMTNGHPGNRRFRDIISLHRPDYIRAGKMDKPKVARRIVGAIRQGTPPGRFLRKGDDGKWYDVGDRCAAEKTSQGLRERSNAEKRQRSALREALRIRKEDLAEDGTSQSSPNKKQKLNGADVSADVAALKARYAVEGTPLSLAMKEKSKESKSKKSKKDADDMGEGSGESLPPNAVDKDGNILVTDHDILCGRGGLTNHHKGNKRFRDIVALHRPDYVRAPKIQKPSVARVIVRAIRNGDPPGRFLRRDNKSGLWYDIGDKRAAEKTSQALREKTNDERTKQPGESSPFSNPALLPKEDESAATGDAAATGTAENGTDTKGEATDDGKATDAAADKSSAPVDVEMKDADNKEVQAVEI